MQANLEQQSLLNSKKAVVEDKAMQTNEVYILEVSDKLDPNMDNFIILQQEVSVLRQKLYMADKINRQLENKLKKHSPLSQEEELGAVVG